MSPQLEEGLLEFLHTTLGPFSVVRFCGWNHAESNVWEILAGDKRFYLKAHKQPRKFQQEVYAYEHWMPYLTFVPRLIALNENPQALLLSAVPGVLAQDAALSGRQEGEVYRRAGAFLRRLHALPFEDTDALPLADALLKRSEAWMMRGEGVLEKQTVAWVNYELESAVKIIRERGWTRVPCHRDYTKRNWLLEGEDLYVIDFEHARSDLFLSDFERLRSLVWLPRPELEIAFFEGYGRGLTEEERLVLERLALQGALVTIVWAREHGDERFERQGREVLRRFNLRATKSL